MLKYLIKRYTDKIIPITFSTVDSTNNIARSLAKQGADEGVAVIANRQTAGRGRLGRTFLSKNGGVYMSVILRPQIPSADTLFITVAAAVAAAQAIEEISGKKCEIKWVNDIYIDGKKVCGILTEGEIGTNGTLDYAILGIGVNLFMPWGRFPKELPLADSVFCKNSNIFIKNDKKARFIASFVQKFMLFYKSLQKKEFLPEYKARSFLNNRQITYTKDGTTLTATVVGIDDNANLVVKSGDNAAVLSHGEIQIVGMEQPQI